jgi:hypothetical protein
MAGKAMTPSAICDVPLIRPGHVVAEKTIACPTNRINSKLNKENEVTSKSKHSDLLLQGFWARGTNCIVDVRVMDTDAKTYASNLQPKSLCQAEKGRRKSTLRGLP